MATEQYILTLSCANQPGIVAKVSAALFDHGGNIGEAHQFDDPLTGRFFMRVVFDMSESHDSSGVSGAIAALGESYAMTWELHPRSHLTKVLLLVSKFDHCLGDLLYRYRIGEMKMDVVGIVSNHPREALKISMIGDIPYHYFPVAKDTKPQQEAQIKQVVKRYRRRTDRAGPLHADPVGRPGRLPVGPLHQHPPQLPAGLQGRQALSSGACARRENDRRDLALRDRGPG